MKESTTRKCSSSIFPPKLTVCPSVKNKHHCILLFSLIPHSQVSFFGCVLEVDCIPVSSQSSVPDTQCMWSKEEEPTLIDTFPSSSNNSSMLLYMPFTYYVRPLTPSEPWSSADAWPCRFQVAQFPSGPPNEAAWTSCFFLTRSQERTVLGFWFPISGDSLSTAEDVGEGGKQELKRSWEYSLRICSSLCPCVSANLCVSTHPMPNDQIHEADEMLFHRLTPSWFPTPNPLSTTSEPRCTDGKSIFTRCFSSLQLVVCVQDLEAWHTPTMYLWWYWWWRSHDDRN